MIKFIKCWILLVILSVHEIDATHFTFDLVDGAEQCFYEVIKENVTVEVDYSVS